MPVSQLKSAKRALYLKPTFFTLFICVMVFIAYSLRYVNLGQVTWNVPGGRRSEVMLLNLTEDQGTKRNNTKLIMFWTRRSNRRNWFLFPENETTRLLSSITNCSRECIFTSDHSRLREADMLLFYRGERPNWPRVRYANQYYSNINYEAPSWPQDIRYLQKYEGRINITVNYRRDADFYIPYNTFVPRDNYQFRETHIPYRNKTKMVIWPVSHCYTRSHRENYVKELSKYIDVDIYGACGKYKCSKSKGKTCLEEWERKYKFHLSFENSICEDYITEKAFLPLLYELIPVVFGGGNYSRDMPPHSFINARDFNSPKHLADFLISLAADEQRYRSYFEWKKQYKIVGFYLWFTCR